MKIEHVLRPLDSTTINLKPRETPGCRERSSRSERPNRMRRGVRVIAAIVAAHRITFFKCEKMWINELNFSTSSRPIRVLS